MTDEHTATFELDKVTENTYRYAEENDGPPIVGSLYVKQWVLGDEPPARIRATVEVLDE